MHVTLLQAHCMHVTQLQNGSALAYNGSPHEQCPTPLNGSALELAMTQLMNNAPVPPTVMAGLLLVGLARSNGKTRSTLAHVSPLL